MPSTLPPAEGPTAHTSTQQWQSFEARMRQRRIERLLLRADAALEAGTFAGAREALEEIEQLDPQAPGVAERRARLETALAPTPLAEAAEPAFASSLTVGNAPLLDLELRSFEAAASEKRRWSRVLGRATAAVLAIGAIAWFAIPRDWSDPVIAIMARSWTPSSNPAPVVSPAEPRAETPASPLPPVRVAVDEVPAANTVAEAVSTDPGVSEPQRPQSAHAALATSGAEVRPPTVADERPSAASEPAAAYSALPEANRRTSPVDVNPPSDPDPPTIPVSSATPPEDRTSVTPLPTAPPPVPLVPPTAHPTNAEATVTAPRERAADRNASPPPSNAASNVAPATGVAAEEISIRSLLSRYEAAYSQLDVDAAGAVFPGLDRRALARAFDGLASQNVNLGSCDVRVIGDVATAECIGSAAWRPKVGGGTRSQPRRWQFQLRNISGWKIVGANVR